jgi:hypothetical protein
MSLLTLLLAATLGSAAQAPAPAVTVAGVVRDQTGDVLVGATVSDALK